MNFMQTLLLNIIRSLLLHLLKRSMTRNDVLDLIFTQELTLCFPPY
jgi:hypothetical protein